MNKSEALAVTFTQMEKEWTSPSSEADHARGVSVRRLWAGETLKFVYHPWSNHEPVDEVMREAGAVGQLDLGLEITPLIHVWKPSRVNHERTST